MKSLSLLMAISSLFAANYSFANNRSFTSSCQGISTDGNFQVNLSLQGIEYDEQTKTYFDGKFSVAIMNTAGDIVKQDSDVAIQHGTKLIQPSFYGYQVIESDVVAAVYSKYAGLSWFNNGMDSEDYVEFLDIQCSFN